MTERSNHETEAGHGYCRKDTRRVRNCPMEMCKTLGACCAGGTSALVDTSPILPQEDLDNVDWMKEYAEEADNEIARQGGSRADGPLLGVLLPSDRQMMPLDSQVRKNTPLCTGVLDYFPLALAAIARLSKYGNDKHNPGQPLHWSRGKSSDHPDCIMRHLADRGVVNPDTGESHSVELAWRSLALLEEEEEARLGLPTSRGSR